MRTLIASCRFRSASDEMQGDWIWICVVSLWQRSWPGKVCLERQGLGDLVPLHPRFPSAVPCPGNRCAVIPPSASSFPCAELPVPYACSGDPASIGPPLPGTECRVIDCVSGRSSAISRRARLPSGLAPGGWT